MPRRRYYPKTFQVVPRDVGRAHHERQRHGDVGARGGAVAKLDVTAVSGTTPSLTVTIEESPNGSTGWVDAHLVRGPQHDRQPDHRPAALEPCVPARDVGDHRHHPVVHVQRPGRQQRLGAAVSDPFDRALAAFAEARSERDTLKSRAEKARLEIHQLRRRLQVAEDQNRTLLERVADADQRAETAEREAGSARRAMLDHAGRT
jgi:hypothetical protein